MMRRILVVVLVSMSIGQMLTPLLRGKWAVVIFDVNEVVQLRSWSGMIGNCRQHKLVDAETKMFSPQGIETYIIIRACIILFRFLCRLFGNFLPPPLLFR